MIAQLMDLLRHKEESIMAVYLLIDQDGTISTQNTEPKLDFCTYPTLIKIEAYTDGNYYYRLNSDNEWEDIDPGCSLY